MRTTEATRPVSIDLGDFPKDGLPWRIDGLGRLYHAGSSRSEPLIDVHLSQLKPNYSDPLSNLSLSGPSAKVAVKVGQIELLKHGSIWVDRGRVFRDRAPAWRELTVHPEDVEFFQFNSTMDFEGRSIHVLGPERFFVGTASWLGLADSWLVVVRRPAPDIPYLVIPSTVIFQKCLAVCPEGIRRVVCGELHRIVGKPKWVPAEDGLKTYFVEVAKDIRSRHAYAYANLLADQAGQAEYERLRRTLVAASVNESPASRAAGKPMHMKLGLPFSAPVAIRVIGKPLPIRVRGRSDVAPQFAFLATEIVSLDVQLVFDRLVAHRKNDGRQGENAGDPDLGEGWGVPPQSEVDLDDDDSVPVESGEDPLASVGGLHVEEAGGYNAVGLQVVKDPKLTQEYRHKAAIDSEGDFDGTATTGDAKAGNEGPARLDIDADEAPRAPVTLDAFFDTLQMLREAGHEFETLVVSVIHHFNDRGDVANYFPREVKGVRTWHLISDDPISPPRAYVVARIRVGNVWHYLIELERKGSENRALAHLHVGDGSMIDARPLRQFMFEVARNNGWGASRLRPHWVFDTINHTPKQGLGRFAQFIAMRLGLSRST